MDQEQEQDRNEPATPSKRREAVKRGQVAKSLEVNSFVVTLGAAVVLAFWGQQVVQRQLAIERSLFEQATRADLDIPQLFAVLESVFIGLAKTYSPLIALLLVLVILSNLIQTGPVFSFVPLKPDPKRLNPVAGFKRVFSKRMLFESAKSVIKLLLFGTVLYFAVVTEIPGLLGMMHSDPRSFPLLILNETSNIFFRLAMAILLLAILDVVYTRWEYSRKLMMSRREIKEEVKRREGDPKVRARIRELQREAAKRSKALRRVPEADVLITNPTHLAVALLYQRGVMAAPTVIAKGAGELVEKMKMTARRHRIPIIENRTLARSLFQQAELEAAIPAESYAAVAEVLVRAYAVRGRHGEETVPA